MKTELTQKWTLEPGGRQCRVKVWRDDENMVCVLFYPTQVDLKTTRERKADIVNRIAKARLPKERLPLDEKCLDFTEWRRRRIGRS